jgi:hypothetical protein
VLRVAVLAGLLVGAAIGPTACGSSAEGRGSELRPLRATQGSPAPGATIMSDQVRVLAYGVLPNGQGFWISARRYLVDAKASIDLTANLEPQVVPRRGIHEAFGSAGGGTLTPDFAQGPLALGGLVACAGSPVTLLVGLLRVRSDTAVLRDAGHSRAMTRVALPPDLRSGDDLEYAYANRASKVTDRMVLFR